jgi:hypothetical protein
MKRFQHLAIWFVCAALNWPVSAAADAVTDWNEIANGAVATGRPGPIGASDLALVQLAVHDAIQAYEKRFEPYYAVVKPAGSKVAAAIAAAHGVLLAFYPAQAATLDATYGTYLANAGLTGNAGIAVGEDVAAKIATLRRLDPNPLPLPFTGGTGIGEWRPTESLLPGPPPTLAPMFAPWMSEFDPLALTGPARFRAPPPPDLLSDKYTADYNEVKAKGALTNSTRTPEQTDIAYFWTDNFFAQWNRAMRAIIENAFRISATEPDCLRWPTLRWRMPSSRLGTARSTTTSGVRSRPSGKVNWMATRIPPGIHRGSPWSTIRITPITPRVPIT